jgi:hypothetical protein
LMLAKHANPDGTEIYPSQQTLAEECGGLTEYTLRRVIKWLEDHQLVRRLPDLHPKLGTIQYELLWPEAAELEKGKRQAADRLAWKREATRKRTEKWRSSKRQSQTVTQTVSVTPGLGDANLQRSVTQPCDAVTLGCDAVTQPCDACDAENPAFSPSTVLLDRPSRPSLKPSYLPPPDSDGRKVGSSAHLETQASKNTLAGNFARWVSNTFYAITNKRYIANSVDLERMEQIVKETDIGEAALAVYCFCRRPKGVSGLFDAFGALWNEWPQHLADARQELADRSLDDALDEMHSDVFPYEDLAREENCTRPSVSTWDSLQNILGPPCQKCHRLPTPASERIPDSHQQLPGSEG